MHKHGNGGVCKFTPIGFSEWSSQLANVTLGGHVSMASWRLCLRRASYPPIFSLKVFSSCLSYTNSIREKNLLNRGKQLSRRSRTTRRYPQWRLHRWLTQTPWKSVPWTCPSWCKKQPTTLVKSWSSNSLNSLTPGTKLPAAWKISLNTLLRKNSVSPPWRIR